MARISVLPSKIIELLATNHLLSVSQMQAIFKKDGESFNKSSVYRALDKLLEKGEICKQVFGDGEFIYELRSEHHDHAVCNNCEKIITIECSSHPNKKVPGFKVDHHHTILYGLCNSCLK